MAKREQPEPGTMGARILEMREAWEMDTEAFSKKLNAIARKLEHEDTWSASKVSRASNNKLRMKLDEAIDLMNADKKGRGLDWLVFGFAEHRAAIPGKKRRLTKLEDVEQGKTGT